MTDTRRELHASPQPPCTVRAIMAMSASGSATINGSSGALGNDADAQLLQSLRDWAQVIVVGAQTVREEDYSGARPDPAHPDQQPARIAVLSHGLKFDLRTKFFTDHRARHLFLAPQKAIDELSGSSRFAALKEHGDFLACPSPRQAIETLRAEGFERIVCEGGPSVLGELLAADQIDEIFLTISPIATAPVETPLVGEPDSPAKVPLALKGFRATEDGTVFLHYGRVPQ